MKTIQHKINHYWQILKDFAYRRPWISLVIAIVVIWGGYHFIGGNGVKEDTLTIKRGDFLQQVSVSGKVVASQNVNLGFDQGGRVSGVYVKVGDYVSSGKVLANIENGDLRAALDAEKAKLDGLNKGTRVEDINISQVAVQGAINDVTEDIKSGYVNSDDAIRGKVDQFISNPKGANPQLNFYTGSDSQLKSDIENGRITIEGILTSWNTSIAGLSTTADISVNITEAKKNLKSIQSYLDRVSLAVNSLTSSTYLTQTTIDGYKAAITTARTNVTNSLNSLTASEEKYKNAKSELALKQAGTVKEQVDAQMAQVKLAEARLNKTVMVAPFDGIITKMDAKVGEIVSPNSSEISMISQGNFQIESYVPEINIALLKVGNKASVTLDAYGDQVLFDASVVSLDPAETLQDGVATYRAVLQFKNQDARIKSGMTASVVITTDEKKDVIAVPQGVVATTDGKKTVKVKEGGNIVDREVTTGGVSSFGQIEILSGLKEGDVVVLGEKK